MREIVSALTPTHDDESIKIAGIASTGVRSIKIRSTQELTIQRRAGFGAETFDSVGDLNCRQKFVVEFASLFGVMATRKLAQ